MKLLKKVLNMIFPNCIYCITCGSIIDNTRSYSICDNCIEKFHWVSGKTCEICGKILDKNSRRKLCYDCMSTEHSFDKGYTCTQYGLYERVVMMDYKFADKSYLGRILGQIMYDRISCENLSIDYIIPVPIHWKKKKERGYNQAEIMANVIGKSMNKKVLNNVLVRNRWTDSMKDLGAQERRENVKDAFSIISESRNSIGDKVILLIDDIYTTGSTLDSCARELKKAGVDKVFVLTFAAGGNTTPKIE